MGALLASLFALGGLGGLGWWWSRRPASPGPGAVPLPDGAPPLALRAPAELEPGPEPGPEATPAPAPASPAPAWPVPPPIAPRPRPPAPVVVRPPAPVVVRPARPIARPAAPLAPSDFVQRMRAWLQTSPPPTQVELVATHLEAAGHPETARQLRAWARQARQSASSPTPAPTPARATPAPPSPTVAPASPLGPPEPASAPPAPGGSSESSSVPGSPSSSTSEREGAPPAAPSPAPEESEPALRPLARRVAAMLVARQGQPTDRSLVREFQRAARVFGDREPSGLYGPATREALARHGVRNPPRPRFRAQVEAQPPRARPAPPSARSPRSPTRPAPAAPRPALPVPDLFAREGT